MIENINVWKLVNPLKWNIQNKCYLAYKLWQEYPIERWNIFDEYFDSANMALKLLPITLWCGFEDSFRRIQIEKKYWLHYEQLKKMKSVEIDVYLIKLQSIEISILRTSVWGCILQQSCTAMTKLCAVYVDF